MFSDIYFLNLNYSHWMNYGSRTALKGIIKHVLQLAPLSELLYWKINLYLLTNQNQEFNSVK